MRVVRALSSAPLFSLACDPDHRMRRKVFDVAHFHWRGTASHRKLHSGKGGPGSPLSAVTVLLRSLVGACSKRCILSSWHFFLLPCLISGDRPVRLLGYLSLLSYPVLLCCLCATYFIIMCHAGKVSFFFFFFVH